MRKAIHLLGSLLLIGTIVSAQSIEDGIRNLYYQKYASAKSDFEKVITTKPNDERAYYYLGISELGLKNVQEAKNIFNKGLAAIPNAPLLTVGLGRIDLMEGNATAARGKFDAALASLKGKNSEVSRAIADANTEVKGGDRAFAMKVMEDLFNNEGAKKRDIYTPTVLDHIELGDAYRYLGGEYGGKAISAYERASDLDPNNAEAVLKKGLVNYNANLLEHAVAEMSKATNIDPNYGPAFYELYAFYFTPKPRQFSLPKAKEFLEKYLAVADPNDKINNDYYLASIMFFNKDYKGAIQKANTLLAQSNSATKLLLNRLIVDSYLQKGDSLTAKAEFDKYVSALGKDNLESNDYKLGAEVYGRIKTQDSTELAALKGRAIELLEGYAVSDTSQNVERYETVAKAYADALLFDKAGDWYMKVIEFKKAQSITPSAVDFYNAGQNYYRSSGKVDGTDTVQINKAVGVFQALAEAYPDITTGHYWTGISLAAKDVEAKTGVALEPLLKYVSMAEGESEKNRTGLIRALTYIMVYYFNSDDNTNLEATIAKLEPLDPTNEPLLQIREHQKRK
jgi:tetratricopeptide (TPR) repeat protein